jgi:hypothetical protein
MPRGERPRRVGFGAKPQEGSVTEIFAITSVLSSDGLGA